MRERAATAIGRMRRRHAGPRPHGDSPQRPEPLDPASQPPVDQYCDLVLTGGVADGVVYPWAIVELARKYRFKNIGGTSVGAMAAALTAAAEYARRHGHLSGFDEVLLKLPEKLGEPVHGHTRLFSLFQPAPATQRLFDLLVGFLSDSKTRELKEHPDAQPEEAAMKLYALNVRRGLLNAARIYWRQIALAGLFVASVAALVHAAFPQVRGLEYSGFQWFVISLVVLVFLLGAALLTQLLIGVSLFRDLTGGLVHNNFGLCNGSTVGGRSSDDEPSLIDWLHKGIQGAARRSLEQPLTFKDLWEAPGGPAARPMAPAQPTRTSRSIDLRMVTASLTHGRPCTLPLGESDRLFFKLSDIKPYFPRSIVRHLVRHSRRYAPRDGADPPKAPPGIRELPTGELPVLVAARLSLSFPFLFSAVPLWAIDYEPRRQCRTLRRAWFSDGGICSNFPIHMFDAAVPRWPTFGISLRPKGHFQQRSVWLPQRHNEGRGDGWNRFGDEVDARDETRRIRPSRRLFGFIGAIVGTAKDWNDRYSAIMPGVRDRVVYIFREKNEGGLNLKLSSEDILEFADAYGREAGIALVRKFQPDEEGGGPAKAWNEHRWVRFNTFLDSLRDRIEGLTEAAERTARSMPISEQIEQARTHPPLDEKGASQAQPGKRGSGPLPAAYANDLQRLLTALTELEAAVARHETTYRSPQRPMPVLRVRPPL